MLSRLAFGTGMPETLTHMLIKILKLLLIKSLLELMDASPVPALTRALEIATGRRLRLSLDAKLYIYSLHNIEWYYDN